MYGEEASENLKQVLYGGTMAFLVLAGFIIFFSILYMKRKNRHLLEKKEMESNFRQELLKSQLEIQEQTLRNISEEIHDNIGQVLSLAKLNLSTMDLSQQEKTREKIASSKMLVSKAIQDLRDLSRSMNTDNIEAIGLVKAIENELDIIRKNGFETTLEMDGLQIKLEPQSELIIFRIVQEAFGNILKHAAATLIGVSIHYRPTRVDIIVSDNGVGFDGTLAEDVNSTKRPGLGIRNMHNRAKLVHGDFSISSTKGKGTSVMLSVNLKNS